MLLVHLYGEHQSPNFEPAARRWLVIGCVKLFRSSEEKQAAEQLAS